MDIWYDFVDDYDHIDDDLEYILENVLSEDVVEKREECEESKQLNELFNTVLINKCECDEKNQQYTKCSHGANYVLNEAFQELVLRGDSNHIPDLIYECSHMCTCEPRKCRNRLVQGGPRKFLKIVHSAQYCSKGLITTRDIPKGAFICEYAGELLTIQEARNVIRKNEKDHNMNYVLLLKESCISRANNIDGETLITIVNPRKKGNIGRYLNHSCDPNCQIISVRIDSPIPKIAFFSKRYIKAGEEICFNYNEGAMENKIQKISANRIPCLCGSKHCIKYLPNSE